MRASFWCGAQSVDTLQPLSVNGHRISTLLEKTRGKKHRRPPTIAGNTRWKRMMKTHSTATRTIEQQCAGD
ncbi:hypothetical protein XAP6164_3050024 [Xanthomonas phaseoli pv. phaseoli]|nr:hypothetical protein XAP6164_3050024 [Xanthomonas phaseoli pv. phaseoli]